MKDDLIRRQDAIDGVHMEVKCCENCMYWDDFHKSLIVPERFPCTMPIMQIETEAKDYCIYFCSRKRREDGTNS